VIETLLNSVWINRFSQYSVLYVGFSGGLDSTVLLHCLASEPTLLAKIHAVHINHGLSPHALKWEHHCQQLCTAWSIPLTTHRVVLPRTHNVEENARVARYAVFYALLTKADALLLAHHQDDQAETLLLNLMRGAGVDGLAAMEEIQPLVVQGDLLRPLLSYSRKALESYARQFDLSWVDDESNQDEYFSRNFIRHRLMPLLQEKWPQAARSIARAARHCQDASNNLAALAKMDCVDLTTQTTLSVASVKRLSRERALNSLGVWLKHHGHQRPSEKTLNRLIDEVVLARIDAVPMVSFGDVSVRRYRDDLYCLKNVKRVLQTVVWSNFPSPLSLGSSIDTLHAKASSEGLHVPLSSRLEVRFRTGGEQLRLHGQTKTLKHLFQQWQVPPWERAAIPLLYINDELAVVVGYAVSDYFYAKETSLQNTYILILGNCYGRHDVYCRS